MTTLLISEIFPPRTGGSGRWFWEIYRRLPRTDYIIAAGEHPGAAAFDTTHDLRIHRLPLSLSAWGIKSMTGVRGYLRAVRQLRRLVKQHHITMVHCGRCLPEGFMAYLLSWWSGVPYACYVHGEDVTTAATGPEAPRSASSGGSGWPSRSLIVSLSTLSKPAIPRPRSRPSRKSTFERVKPENGERR